MLALLLAVTLTPMPVPAQSPAPIAQDVPVEADTGAARFLQSCAGCHTVGEGPLTGPDLASHQSWSAEELTQGIIRMQDRTGPLSDSDIQHLVTLLKNPTAKQRLAAAREQQTKTVETPLSPPSARIGQRLFTGSQPLEHGGMACAACHRVAGRGGTLGRDLTDVGTRLSQTALAAAIQQAGYKIMNASYRAHPITAQEAAHLAMYLATPPAQPAPAVSPVPLFGLIGGVLLLGGIIALYGKRRPGARARLQRRDGHGLD